MKKISTLFILSLFLVGSAVYAQEQVGQQSSDFEASELVIVDENEVINKDFFGSGEVVEIAGTVNGDVYAAGERIEISGTVNGDVLAAGGTITISGTVTDDIRVAGGQIAVPGIVGKNVTAVGGNVVINNDAAIDGSLVLAAGNITVNAPIKKNIVAAGGNVALGNIIQGDVTAATGQLIMHPNAQVNGDLLQIEGPDMNRPQTPEFSDQQAASAVLFFKFLQFIATFIFGLFLIHLFPKYMVSTTKVMVKDGFKSFLLGVISFIAAPVVAIVLMVTIIGAPLGMVLFVAYFIGIYVARIIFAFAVGLEIKKRAGQKWHDGWSYLSGLLVYAILSSIPIVGWILAIVVWWLGLGALIISEKDFYMKLKEKRLI